MQAYAQLSQVYDAFMGRVDYEGWAKDIAETLKDHGVLPGAEILDAACGTGSIAIPLKKGGYRVTASDISEEMLNIAAARARSAAANIQFIQEDMRCVHLHQNVAAVLATCDAVNYLDGIEEAREFFENAYQNLLPGGVLIFDISTKARLMEGLGNNVFFEEFEEGSYVLETQYLDDRCDMALTGFIREGELYRRFYEEHTLYAFDISTLKRVLCESGFVETEVRFLMQGNCIETQRAQFLALKRKG